VYIPNYYRGAFHQYPRQAGRSSHLFNTGTISWLYRCLVEELCGLKGSAKGLLVAPKLPTKLTTLKGQRRYKGALIDFVITKDKSLSGLKMYLENQLVEGDCLSDLNAGCRYTLTINIPEL